MQNIIQYTLVSHAPDEQGWFDRCGDYHKGKESQISITTFLDKEKAIEALSKAYVDNSQGLNQLLINGVAQYEIPQEWESSEDPQVKKYCVMLEDLHNEIDDKVFYRTRELEEEKKLKAQQKIESEKLAKLKQEQDQLKQAELAEKELLRSLLAKHGNL